MIRVIAIIRKIVEKAAIEGSGPPSKRLKINTGAVTSGDLDRKMERLTLSNDTKKANRAADTIAGLRTGNVILRKTVSLLLPRLIAASSIDLSNPLRAELMNLIAKGKATMLCPIVRGNTPAPTLIREKI